MPSLGLTQTPTSTLLKDLYKNKVLSVDAWPSGNVTVVWVYTRVNTFRAKNTKMATAIIFTNK